MAAVVAAVRKSRNEDAVRAKELDEKMRKAFDDVDADNSGMLSLDEILEGLSRIDMYDPATYAGQAVKKRVVRHAGDDGELDFFEFKKLVNNLTDVIRQQSKWDAPVDWLPYSNEARRIYKSSYVTFGVAATIVINFIATVIQSDIDPYEDEIQVHYAAWRAIDSTCNVIFLIELLVNMYAHFWRPFLTDPWSYLDVPVVIVGVFSLAEVDLGPLKSLKMLRALRILRLFKRIDSLNNLLNALMRSIPGVVNAFAVTGIFMIIFAIIAVDLFRDFGNDGVYVTSQNFGVGGDATWGVWKERGMTAANASFSLSQEVPSLTPRGFHYGQEYFGTFSRSLYTLFQVLTGESWSEAVVRPLVLGKDQGHAGSIAVGIFFTLFIVLMAMVLMNVVVMVLIDNFLDAAKQAKAAKAAIHSAFLVNLSRASISADSDGGKAALELELLRKASAIGGMLDKVHEAFPENANAPKAGIMSRTVLQTKAQTASLIAELAEARKQLDLIQKLLPPPGQKLMVQAPSAASSKPGSVTFAEGPDDDPLGAPQALPAPPLAGAPGAGALAS